MMIPMLPADLDFSDLDLGDLSFDAVEDLRPVFDLELECGIEDDVTGVICQVKRPHDIHVYRDQDFQFEWPKMAVSKKETEDGD